MAEQKGHTKRPVRRRQKMVDRGRIISELARESEMVLQKRRFDADLSLKPLDDNPMHVRKFRFRRSAAGSGVVTADSLMNLIVVGRGSTTFTRLFGTIRLLKVELWTSVLANANGANNASLEFNPDLGADAFDQSPPQVFEAVSTGSSTPGHICVRPGVLCKIGRPMNATGAGATAYQVFRTLGNPGDIIEVTLEYNVADAALTSAHSLTGSGGFAGLLAENSYLDNTSTSSTSGTQILANLTAFYAAVAIG